MCELMVSSSVNLVDLDILRFLWDRGGVVTAVPTGGNVIGSDNVISSGTDAGVGIKDAFGLGVEFPCTKVKEVADVAVEVV